jgi:hypothetical protein
MPIFEPETLLNTPIEDLYISSEHPIPEWLKEDEDVSMPLQRISPEAMRPDQQLS